MAKSAWIKVNGEWKKVKNAWQKVGDVWRPKVKPKLNVSGIWKDIMSYGYHLFIVKDNGVFNVEKLNDETGALEKTSQAYTADSTVTNQWSVVDKDGNIYISFDQTIVKYDKDMNEISRRTYIRTSEIVSASGTDIEIQTVTDTHLIVMSHSANSSADVIHIYAISLDLGLPELKGTLPNGATPALNALVYHKPTNQFLILYGQSTTATYLRKYDGNFNIITTLNVFAAYAAGKACLGLSAEGIYMMGLGASNSMYEMTYDVNLPLTSQNVITRHQWSGSGDNSYTNATPCTTKDGKIYYTYKYASSANPYSIYKYDTLTNTRILVTQIGPYNSSSWRYDWCPTGRIEQIVTNPKGELFVRDDGLVAKLNMDQIAGPAIWVRNQGTASIVVSSEGTPYELPEKWS